MSGSITRKRADRVKEGLNDICTSPLPVQRNFEKSGHPTFRCIGALEKGQLRSKHGRKTTIHFTVCEENVPLLLGTVMSVNQLSLHGAVADMIQE